MCTSAATAMSCAWNLTKPEEPASPQKSKSTNLSQCGPPLPKSGTYRQFRLTSFCVKWKREQFAGHERSCRGDAMYHYNPQIALEELQEDALLPHPVKLRDMILRNQLGPQDAQLLNHDFQEYLTRFGELQKIARGILDKLAAGQRKTA